MSDTGHASAPRRIVEPREVPVIGTDAHLPALTAQHLHPHALRARFVDSTGWQPAIPGDGRLIGTGRAPAPAAVLVPLVQRDAGLQVLLTRRTAHLRDHAGQISFPGGRVEADDADAVATALREAQEEVGLPADQVSIIGQLPAYATVTNCLVTPVVGLVRPPLALALDAFEVAEAFEVPLAFLMTPAHHRRHRFEFDGVQREFLSMPWRSRAADGAECEYFIWGATASMLRNLYHFLAR